MFSILYLITVNVPYLQTVRRPLLLCVFPITKRNTQHRTGTIEVECVHIEPLVMKNIKELRKFRRI